MFWAVPRHPNYVSYVSAPNEVRKKPLPWGVLQRAEMPDTGYTPLPSLEEEFSVCATSLVALSYSGWNKPPTTFLCLQKIQACKVYRLCQSFKGSEVETSSSGRSQNRQNIGDTLLSSLPAWVVMGWGILSWHWAVLSWGWDWCRYCELALLTCLVWLFSALFSLRALQLLIGSWNSHNGILVHKTIVN